MDMYIYDIITETFVEFYYRDLNTPTGSKINTKIINHIKEKKHISIKSISSQLAQKKVTSYRYEKSYWFYDIGCLHSVSVIGCVPKSVLI